MGLFNIILLPAFECLIKSFFSFDNFLGAHWGFSDHVLAFASWLCFKLIFIMFKEYTTIYNIYIYFLTCLLIPYLSMISDCCVDYMSLSVFHPKRSKIVSKFIITSSLWPATFITHVMDDAGRFIST